MSVNTTIEDWAKGLGTGSRVGSEQKDTGDLKGWSASGPTNEDAAKAVYEALRGATGRRKKAWRWSAIAKEVLGLKRMSTKRWEEIVKAGESLNLFRVDSDSLSFPILVVVESAVVESEDVESEDVEEAAGSASEAGWKRDRNHWKTGTSGGGGTGPRLLPCGHFDWFKEGDHIKARAEGKCCAGWKQQRQWRVAGLTMPVPENQRRSLSRSSSGWQGLCCDPKTGLYIGGVGNDCRHYHEGKERCVVHQKRGS